MGVSLVLTFGGWGTGMPKYDIFPNGSYTVQLPLGGGSNATFNYTLRCYDDNENITNCTRTPPLLFYLCTKNAYFCHLKKTTIVLAFFSCPDRTLTFGVIITETDNISQNYIQ